MSAGYRPCACRDCFETAIGEAGALCHDCEEAGCTPCDCDAGDCGCGECQRTDAYGVEDEG